MAMFVGKDETPAAMKTIKQEESVSRSRFVDCPVCKNHTLKLKRVVQVGRCKTCNESYKIVIVYVKTGKKMKQSTAITSAQSEAKQATAEPTLPSWQIPSDTSLFGSTGESYSGLSDPSFNYGKTGHDDESQSSSGQ